MSAALPYAANQTLTSRNCVFLPQNYKKTSAISEVIISIPKKSRKDSSHFPELSINGVCSTDKVVREIVQRQSKYIDPITYDVCKKPSFHPMFLEEAYERCKDVCSEYAKTFYLGTSYTFALH